MKASIIIPTFRRSEFLIRAIDSVFRQDYENFELIIIDDNGIGSEFHDINVKTLSKYVPFPQFRYYAMPKNTGGCAARNKGAELAEGDVLMFLDDDDYYFPDKVSKQMALLCEPTVDACLCGMKRVDNANSEIISSENFPRGLDLKSFIIDGNCFTTMISVRRDAFVKIGGFSEISRYQDKYFMYKFYKHGLKSCILHLPLFVMVEHEQDRISSGAMDVVCTAIQQLFIFEQAHFHLLTEEEILLVKRRYYFRLAEIRTNSKIVERFRGLVYLGKSCALLLNPKLILRLIISDLTITMIKRLFSLFILRRC